MSHNFIDEMKYIVGHPKEWPKSHLAVCSDRYSDVKNDFNKPTSEQQEKMERSLFFGGFGGVRIIVDESVPPDEIRFISYKRNAETGEYDPHVDRIINVQVPGE